MSQITDRPGFSASRFRALMDRTIAATKLNLSGLTILTEASTGAYASTAVIAAMAGAARVYAFTKATRYGSIADVEAWTMQLASEAGVEDRITILQTIPREVPRQVDIVTNSGHLRPLSAELIDELPSHAVIGLMFEAWEFRPGDIDVEACVRRGIPIVGVNERHPAVDVFSFLGPLCVKQLHDCGLAVYSNRIALLCDNDFAGSMLRGLRGLGASVEVFAGVEQMVRDNWDAVIVALQPASGSRIGEAEARRIAETTPAGTTVVQFWGDIERPAVQASGLRTWPPTAPGKGHMAVLLSDIGPEAIVRLQTGGLRAAEWVLRGGGASPDGFAQMVHPTQ